jgi:PiT family inorganic phosphate transporter
MIGLIIVGSALVGATAWNLLTWWKGLPSSSSHALFGGMVGASLAAGTTVLWGGVLDKIVIPMVLSPVLGLILGYFLMTAILWIFRRQHPGRATRGFRYAQTVSAAAMALGHGLQDAGKTMGIIVLALTVGGYQDGSSIPVWVKISTALVISFGTYAGGWRIMRTLGRKIIHLDPPQGFAAESAGASILYVAGLGFGAPISTTHTITSTIMGVGATKRLSAVRWGVARNIVTGWVFTFPGAGLVAALVYLLTIPFQ